MPDVARRNRLALAPNNHKRWLAPFRERWLAPFVRLLFALGGAALIWTNSSLSGQSAQTGFIATTKNGEWQSYTGDTRGSRYSPLDQINAQNFNDLEVAWRFKTDSLGTRPEYKLEGTPLMVGGVLYTTAGTRRAVVALDPVMGELLWAHGKHEADRAAHAPR